MSRGTNDDSPADLPPIEAVDVVDVRAIDWQRFDVLSEARSSPSVLVAGNEAQAIATLLRILPPGERYRCHTPPFAFRFYVGGRVIAAVSVCWRCNGAFGELRGRPWGFAFDGKHETSHALLNLAMRISGIAVVDG